MTFWDFADHRPFTALLMAFLLLAGVVQTAHLLRGGKETKE